jgi:hypothetical protein
VKRTEFEHAVRAAAAVLGVDELLVIGSQALHGSVESDLPDEADLIDGAIGEASMFHATFGYYAQGVEVVTAVLPKGWQERLVQFQTAGTRDVIAWCLEPHDLWISKMIAGRPKDLEFGLALVEGGIVDPSELVSRLENVDVQEPVRNRIAGKIEAWRKK